VYCSYPILPFGIVACTFFSDNLSRNSCVRSSVAQTGCPGRRQPDDSSSLGIVVVVVIVVQQHVVFLVPSVLRSLPQ